MTPEERWPPDGTYNGTKCTCTDTCPMDCHGTDCDCEACYEAYMDYLSQE